MKTVLATLALLITLGSPAFAQEADKPLDLDATAAAHFGLAVTAFRASQWEAARAEFQACYDLSRRPDLLHNLSLVAEKQGRTADALQLERDFLAHAQLTEPERQESTKRISKLEQTPAPQALPTALPASGAAPSAFRRRLAIGGFVLAGSCLAAALGTGIAGALAKKDLESRPITLMELAAGQNSAVAYQAATISLAIVGSGFLVGSIVLVAKSKKP